MTKLFYQFLVAISFGLIHQNALSQNTASQTVRATNTLMQMTQNITGLDATNMIQLMPPSTASVVEGDPYWDMHWGASSVLLYNNPKLYEGFWTRYDITRDQLEFNMKGQVKVAMGKEIKNVVWIDSLTQKSRFLVNGKDYRLEDVPLTGFLEVLVDGDQQLVKRIELQVLKPNYNVAMSTGSKNSKILKNESFYYATNGDLSPIKSRKSLEPVFGEQSQQMASFIKAEKLRTSREADLVRIFAHLASLRPQQTSN